VARTVRDTSQKLLKKAGRKTCRVIEHADLSEVFGIEMDSPVPAKAPAKNRRKGSSK
jgi:hypothetical protein